MAVHTVDVLAGHAALLAAGKTGAAHSLLAHDAEREALVKELKAFVQDSPCYCGSDARDDLEGPCDRCALLARMDGG